MITNQPTNRLSIAYHVNQGTMCALSYQLVSTLYSATFGQLSLYAHCTVCNKNLPHVDATSKKDQIKRYHF